MMIALSGSTPVTQASTASAPVPPPVAAASTSDRATAPDTVTISDAGRLAAQASQDVDRDGDSH